MKVQLSEYEGCFSVDLTAETMQDAVALARLGMNATKEMRSLGTYATTADGFTGSIVIGKQHRSSCEIQRSK